MGLDNVAVRWPRTGRFYEPVDPANFADFAAVADQAPPQAGPAAALATVIARSATVHATGYTALVDLVLGQEGYLYATEGKDSEEDPVINPEECADLAAGLEAFVARHAPLGEVVTFESVTQILRETMTASPHADKELRWLGSRLDALLDEHREPPVWNFSLVELDVLARFYRRCAELDFAVYADDGA
jgi:hypothetical protein